MHEYNPARRWWTLSVLCLSLVIVVVGNTVLNVALPTLVRELDASSSELQWIVDAYALVFAGLLLTAGALGDRYGRKPALTIGLSIFGAASALSAWAGSPVQLIVLRAVMGLGAALIMPATLSILTNVFPPQERAKAIAIWAGLAGGGAAIGPVAGGFLLEHFWWGSVFLVNIPLVALALVSGRALVPNSMNPAHEPLDPVGAVLSMAGLTFLLYGLIEAPTYGWGSAQTIIGGGLGVSVLVAFGLWELRTPHPMLDLRFFRRSKFATSCLAITTSFFAMFGLFFMVTQYLQLVLGYGTLEAGVRLLPMAFTLTFFAANSARLVERYGARRVVGFGLGVVAMGLLALASADEHSSYWLVIGCMVLMAAGMGISSAPSTTGIMSSLPLGKAGVGSAVNDTTRELGGALGVAVLGSVLASRYSSAMGDVTHGLPGAAGGAARNSLGAALDLAGRLPDAAGERLAAVARHAYADAMSVSLVVAAVAVMAASTLVRRYYPDGLPGQPGHGRGEELPARPVPANGAAPPALPSATSPPEAGNGHGPAPVPAGPPPEGGAQ